MKHYNLINTIAWTSILILTFMLSFSFGYIKGAADIVDIHYEIVEDYKQEIKQLKSKDYGYDLACENSRTSDEWKSCRYLESKINEK